MSNADRIEELRTKYEENPRRYFAPLANEFRKAGDLAHAISICREHLPKQPGHMSGYIVFGQTLFEANSLEEARSVFEQALALDPENLIALKHLGDIARMNGENSVARRWYARVLDADPRNDDIASQLASLGSPTPAVAVPAIVEVPVPEPEPVLEDKPGVFATFDPSSLLDVPNDVVGMVARVAATEEVAVPDEPPEEALVAMADVPEFADDDAPAVPTPTDTRFAARHEPLDLDFPDDPEPPADEAFEEGILAPEWPDTSEFVSRIVTPVRSATSISAPATLDVVASFGRTSSDAIESTQIDAPVVDELVDAFLPEEAAPQPSAPARTGFLAELEAVKEPVDGFDLDVTAEYEIPAHLNAEERVEATGAAAASAVWEIPDFVDEPVAAEESYAEMSSELEAERVAAEFDALQPFEPAAVEREVVEPKFDEPEFDEPEFDEPEFDEPEFDEPELVESVFVEPGFVEPETVLQDLEEPEPVALVTVEAIETETTPTFVTETMAELLVSQGFVSRAIDVYDELVRRRPHDPVLTARLGELRTAEQDELRRADALIAQQRAFETPAIATPAVTPLYNTPLYSTPVRSTPVFTPSTSSSGAFNAQQNAQQAFRTARERFAELASRRVARRTPTHATAVADDPADGLASLFGTSQPTTTDELAARALAEAFGPVQDSGESLFDPVPMPAPAVPLRALTPRHNTAGYPPVQTNPDHRSDPPPAAAYSFDKFFPDPALTHRGAPVVHSSVSGAPDSSQPVNEDLAQFSAWLKGLNTA